MKTKRFITLILVPAFTSLFMTGAFAQQEKKTFTFKDIFGNRDLRSEALYGVIPMNNGEDYCLLGDSLNTYSFAKGTLTGTILETSKLIPKGDTVPIGIDDFEFCGDEKKILFATATESIYRYSSMSEYYIYDRETETLSRLSTAGKQRLATFSPDGNQVAFVRDNNLFVKNLAGNTETKVTLDGKINEIINGASDWVYEEEFGFTKAFCWSPDSRKIAFYRFDESKVPEFSMTMWGELYPEVNRFKYPKAGEPNSVVSVLVYDLETMQTLPVDIGNETDIYIPRIKWTHDPGKLAIQWMNRHQNRLRILLADAATGKHEVIYNEENKFYIDITDNLTFLKDNSHYIMTGEMDGFNHIYLFDMKGNKIRQLTSGPWDVTSFEGVDEKNGLVYYIGAVSSPLNRELYVTDLKGKTPVKLSARLGENRVTFSKNFKYFINTFSDVKTPPFVSVHSASGKELRVVYDNKKLAEKLGGYNYSYREMFSFTTAEGILLNGYMIKPYNFDPAKKYPVLFDIYGGPGSQTVLNRWEGRNMWHQFLATNGVIVVSVDNRGTGARGEEFKKMTYLQLGKYETIDQIEAARYLKTLPYVHGDKIGVWGWSYGGFMATSCITLGAGDFSMAMAVAPVTNWRYYDNIYTERFMRTPAENPGGYDDNSPIHHADKLKGKFLLIHGTADDNVHFQNSVDLVSALVAAKKQFQVQFYPNSNHGIYTGKNTTQHLYTLLTEFVFENLLDKKLEK